MLISEIIIMFISIITVTLFLILKKKCAEFYKGDQDFINFTDKYKGNITYLEKMKVWYHFIYILSLIHKIIWTIYSNIIVHSFCWS